MIDTVQQNLIAEGIANVKEHLRKIRQRITSTRGWNNKKRKAELWQEASAIEDILDNIGELSKVMTKSLEVEKLNLSALVEDIRQMYAPFLEKHSISFHYQITPQLLVKVDQMTFFHIFFNLIHYMGRHANTEAQSFISIEAKPYDNGLVAIYIEDNGNYPTATSPSFDKSYGSKVLDTLAGVGLGVVKEWATAINGSIQMIDKLSPGIKCCLLVPQYTRVSQSEKTNLHLRKPIKVPMVP